MDLIVQTEEINPERLKTLGINQLPSKKNYGDISGTLYETEGTGEAGRLYRQDFIFGKNSYYYWLIFNISVGRKDEGKKLFDQILSTFQFLD